MRVLVVIGLALLICSCGTVKTLIEPEQDVSIELADIGSNCKSLPRVYSGVAYDFCMLNSKPTEIEVNLLVWFYLLDGIFSAIADTIVLPYTISTQSKHGSIDVSD